MSTADGRGQTPGLLPGSGRGHPPRTLSLRTGGDTPGGDIDRVRKGPDRCLPSASETLRGGVPVGRPSL